MKWFLIAGSMIVLSACSESGTSNSLSDPAPKTQIGAITGMVVGEALANDLTEGSKNEGLATVLGAFIGGVMGQSIGSQLDELDRQLAQSAYTKALEYNRSAVSTNWVNPDSGNSGTFTPTRTYTISGQYCREYTQELIIDDQKQTASGTACREADGSWKIVSSSVTKS